VLQVLPMRLLLSLLKSLQVLPLFKSQPQQRLSQLLRLQPLQAKHLEFASPVKSRTRAAFLVFCAQCEGFFTAVRERLRVRLIHGPSTHV